MRLEWWDPFGREHLKRYYQLPSDYLVVSVLIAKIPWDKVIVCKESLTVHTVNQSWLGITRLGMQAWHRVDPEGMGCIVRTDRLRSTIGKQ